MLVVIVQLRYDVTHQVDYQVGQNRQIQANSDCQGRIKKRAAHSENFLGGLVCTRDLAFRLQ